MPMLELLLPTLAAFILPGLVSWLLSRRYGLGVVWAALIAGLIIGIFGWIKTREPQFEEAARQQAVLVYFLLLPGFVSLVTGAAIGAWQHRARSDG